MNTSGSSGYGGDSLDNNAHGSARWLSREELAEIEALEFKPGKGSILLGRTKGGQFVFLNRQGHCCVLAPARSGKGIGIVLPNLVTYREGSMVVIDPRGENCAVTSQYRKSIGQNVIVLDPTGKLASYGIEPPIPTHCFNPIAAFDNANYAQVVDDIGLIIDALLVPKDGEKEQHWRDGAKSFLTGVMTYLVFFVLPEQRNLIMLSRLASGLELPLADLFQALVHNDHPDPVMRDVIAKSGSWYELINPKERASHISVALRSLAWLNSPIWHEHLRRSDFHPFDLKAGKTTLYICLPFEKMDQYAPYLRLILSCCIIAVLRGPRQCDVPTLFLLDEMAALGDLAILSQSIPYIEGSGPGRFMMVFQSLDQMNKLWGDTQIHGKFANCGAAAYFGINDQHSAKHLSEFLGKHTAMTPGAGGPSFVARDLLTPDEIRCLPQTDQIVCIRGYRPAWIEKVNLYQHDPFKNMVETGTLQPNPVYFTRTVQPVLATNAAPLLSASEALARAKSGPKLSLSSLTAALDEKYPDKDLRLENEFVGYDEPWTNPHTGLTETVFQPIVHYDLLKTLTKGGSSEYGA